MRRKIILGAVGATALTIGLGVGATLNANTDSTPPTQTGSITMMDATDTTDGTHMNDGAAMSSMMNGTDMTTMDGTHMNNGAAMSMMMNGTDMSTMDGTHMNDGAAMSSMMNGTAMTSMMGADGMAAMHTAMHETLGDSVPADVLAACDEAHTSMSNAPAPSSTDDASDHTAHHEDAQP